MPPNWTPSNSWTARFRAALMAAFNSDTLELLTADYFGPANTFSNLTSESKTWEYRIYQLIKESREADWLVDLVAAARERRPRNKELGEIAEELGLTSTGPRLVNITGTPLEALIQANAKTITLSEFWPKLAEIEGRVCWIDIPGGGGTGFLVGPDLVVTNYHVIEPIATPPLQANSQDVVCRFDYKKANGSDLANKKTTDVKLHSTKWLEHSKPPSQFDWDPALGEAAPEETDCALIRLAEKIGDIPVGGMTADPAAQPRGWITATAVAPPLSKGNQVFLPQHQKDGPVQLTIGTIKEFNAKGTRVRYDANSKNGSSGSPCFNADLELVALHHAHDPADPPKWNQAVPICTIQNSWNKDGITL